MNNTDRDRAIEALLRSRRADESGAACIDAESLAAWMEGGLPADMRARVEQHAADCARCQALLASMARTAPELEDRQWWRTAMTKWVVPVAAMATALVVWVAVGRNSSPSTPPPASSSPVIEAPREAPAPPVADRPVPPARRRGEEAKREKTSRVDARTGAAAEPTQQSEPRAAVGGIAGGQVDMIRPQAQAGADSVARGPVPPTASPVPSLSPPAPAPVLPVPQAASPSPASSTQSKTAPPGVTETVTVTDATASNLAAARGRGVAGRIDGGPREFEITSADPNYRWRIVPPVSIQRSTDGGRTWAVVDPVPAAGNLPAVILTAGSSPAPDICWIVGRNGVVLISTDGATWRRRQLPESADLIGVRATAATRAVVTTVDGRQFSTTDAGVTWVAVK
jgi:hypothetical protein